MKRLKRVPTCRMWIFLFFQYVVCFAEDLSTTTASSEISITSVETTKDYDAYFTSINHLENLSDAPVITSSARTSQPNSYLLSWKAELNITDIASYIIRYKQASTDIWEYASVTPNLTSLQLKNLEQTSVYHIEMVKLLRRSRVSRLAMSSFRTGKERSTHNSNSGRPVLIPALDPTCIRGRKGSGFKKNCTKSLATAQVPEAPSLPSVTDTSPTSITVIWYPRSNGGSPIIGYKLQMRSSHRWRSGWKTMKRIRSADTRTCDVSDLRKGTSYKFRVVAINKVGESQPSPSVTHDTSFGSDPPRALTTAPEIVSAGIINGSLRLQWDYPDMEPSDFNGYVITYFINDRKQKRKKLRNSAATSSVIKKLKRGFQYSLKMQAFNGRGSSPYSNEVKVRIGSSSDGTGSDKIEFVKPVSHAPDHWNPESGYDPAVQPETETPIPEHNAEVKAKANQRDFAICVAGAAVGVVILILAISGIIYHKNVSLLRKTDSAQRREASEGQLKRGSNLCMKLTGQFCCLEDDDDLQHQKHLSPPPCCSCCDGANSPPRIDDSSAFGMSDCVQSNRTSVSHTILSSGGVLPCARVPGGPMYAMVCDYDPARQLQYCSAAGIAPLWWVRGTDGEFCHIIPHDTKSRSRPPDDLMLKSVESAPDGAPSCSSTMVTRRYSGNVKEDELDSEQVRLSFVEEKEGEEEEEEEEKEEEKEGEGEEKKAGEEEEETTAAVE